MSRISHKVFILVRSDSLSYNNYIFEKVIYHRPHSIDQMFVTFNEILRNMFLCMRMHGPFGPASPFSVKPVNMEIGIKVFYSDCAPWLQSFPSKLCKQLINLLWPIIHTCILFLHFNYLYLSVC